MPRRDLLSANCHSSGSVLSKFVGILHAGVPNAIRYGNLGL